MPVVVPSNSAMAFTYADLNPLLQAAGFPSIPDNTTSWRFTSYKDLISFRARILPTTIGMMIDQATPPRVDGAQFEQNSSTAPPNSYLYFIATVLKRTDVDYTGILVAVGLPQFCASVKRTLLSLQPELEILANEDELNRFPPLTGIRQFTSLGATELTCFLASEDHLFQILEDQTISQESRVCTALVAMFPYILPELQTRVHVVHTYQGGAQVRPEALFGGGAEQAVENARRLTLLAIYLLAPAYTRQDKLHEQIARRTQAAAVQEQLEHYDASRTRTLLDSLQWKIGSMMPIVDDVLAMVICRTTRGTTDPNAPLTELISPGELNRNQEIGRVASSLLEQARLVYTNYHSTSIHFILPVFDPLVTAIGADHLTFREEITRFRGIRTVVSSAPFMGLCAQLPAQYHIKNCARLAYLGLLYHDRSLTTPEEKASFKEYKISGVREHIASQADRNIVENLVDILPSQTVSAIASLVQHISLEKASILMDSKSPEEQLEVLNLLRGEDAPGAWAMDQMNRENATYTRQLIESGVKLLKAALEEQYELRRDAAETLPTPDAVRTRRAALIEWRKGITNMFSNLTDWTEALPSAPRSGMEAIRTTTLARLTEIMTAIRTDDAMEQ
ncbi:hypothetical protein [Pteromalus puparum negative-strand RNA virus 1]|uniref:Uncharacterized protein n=1 Tax=Pteromalus puparum negative-strand RNA virus 1 TaxID=1926633 RepID=A0A1L5BWN7_9MONO|nr:hypothetical protein [Pteromalus puparum negative-strand RNA virus 1]APL97663.1 hypothetical protein [Pteromalus puparum negative-strand RNA virus 1]